MAYQKNDLVTLRIADMGQNGEGIGKAEGYTLFVKDTVIGDVIRAKVIKAGKTYGYGRLMEILEPSADRVQPACPVARQCGGCQLQMLDYREQLRYKENKVENNLRRIGGFAEIPMEPIIGMEDPWRYRNKAQFPIGCDREGNPVAGFYAGRTHTIIPCEDCLLGVPENRQILEEILGWMKENRIPAYEEKTGRGLIRHVLIRKGFSTGELMVCLVINGTDLPQKDSLVRRLCGVEGMASITCSCNRARNNVIMGDNVHALWGRTWITDSIGPVSYRISPLSFYQVNPVQTERLYGTALEFAGLSGRETVWDLYCGIGTISLFLARQAGQVYGVEIVPQAIEDARRNAADNGLENVEFYTGKAEDILPSFYEEGKARADVIIVDPPRKGCDPALLETMVRMHPEKIVYVSCDPATLSRDLKYLCGEGYELKRVRPVDMFPMSVHVETVALMSKKK
jgi:23S rRNA (uracil1939-C5)-methyltransferase